MTAATTITDLQRQVRRLKETKGFEVAAEVLKLPRDGNAGVGEMDAAESEAVVEALGMEIYDVIRNPVDLADMAGAPQRGQRMVGDR